MSSTNNLGSSPLFQGVVSPEDVSPRQLQYVGSTIFSVTHDAMTKANKLPWPVGNAIALMQNTLGTYMDSYVVVVEDKVLQGLGFVDDKMYCTTQECVLIASTSAKKAREFPEQATRALFATADKLHRRGLLGSTADWYIENELALRTYSEGASKFISKVPGGHLLARATSPLAGMAVAWLLKHSEVKDKYLVVHGARSVDVFVDEDAVTHKDDDSNCGPDKASIDELVGPPEEAENVLEKTDNELKGENLSKTQTLELSSKIESQDTITFPLVLGTEQESKDPPKEKEEKELPPTASNVETDNDPKPAISEQKTEAHAVSDADEEDEVPPLKSIEQSEMESSKKAQVIQKDEDHDPVLHLFERTWSSRQPTPSKKKLQNKKLALR